MHINNGSQRDGDQKDVAQFMSADNNNSEFYITEDSVPDDVVPTLTIPAEDVPFNMDVLTLSELPFSEKINSRMFYEEKVCKQCLDMLLHLSQYSDLVINVSGECGFGKTTLLYQVLDRLGEKVFSTTFDASLVQKKEQLEQELCRAFNVSEDSVGMLDFFESLSIHVETIARKFSTVVLLIDNAHEMSGMALDHLSQLTNIKDDAGHSLLHIILFSESSIDQKLEHVFPGELKVQKLAGYSHKETGKYLRHRSNMAGMSLEMYEEIFDGTTILNIHHLSNGVPAKINELANSRLQEVSDKLAPSEKSRKLQSLSRKQLFSSVVILFLMAAGWFFQVELKEYSVIAYQRVVNMIELQDKDVAVMASADNVVTENSSTNENAVGDIPDKEINLVESDVSLIAAEDDSSLVKELKSVSESDEEKNVDIPEQTITQLKQDTKKELVQNTEARETDSKQMSESIPESESKIEQVSIPEVQPQDRLQDQFQDQPREQQNSQTDRQLDKQKSKSPEVVAAEIDEQHLAGLKSSTWLLEQDPQKFTIQIFGAGDKQTVLDTVKKYKLSDAKAGVASDVALFHTKKKNKDWYSLVTGQYADIDSAKNASLKLPKIFVKGVWVRRNKSVQRDIAKVSVKPSSTETAVPEVRREKWLLSQNAQHYTLQLFGSNKEVSIGQFIKTYQLDADVAYFQTQKKGGDWFALTYGIYPDRSDAKQAVDGLPGKLRKQVWIRKLSNVHQDIQATQP